MAFCSKCGAKNDEGTKFCSSCGSAVGGVSNTPVTPAPQQQYVPVAGVVNPNDAPSGGFAFLCFLIPLLGLILYLVWKNESPKKAKSCGKGALIGVIVQVVLWIIIGIGSCVATAAMYDALYY